VQAREDLREGRRAAAVLVSATVIGGVVAALFVIRVGGDFMHGRMLLPALFALMAPVMALPVEVRSGWAVAFAVLGVWAVVCASALRAPYAGSPVLRPGQRITDERAYYVAQAGGHEHPLTLADYATTAGARAGARLRSAAAGRPRVITLALLPSWLYGQLPKQLPAKEGIRQGLIAPAGNVGLLGAAAGRGVWIVDVLGLADPIGGRLRLDRRGRPGHEKVLPLAWIVARFGADAAGSGDRAVAAGRAVLRCRKGLGELLDAVQAPLTTGRFLSNLRVAVTTYGLRVPGDPARAQRNGCP
jgi:arabinofuranosyltransferase